MAPARLQRALLSPALVTLVRLAPGIVVRRQSKVARREWNASDETRSAGVHEAVSPPVLRPSCALATADQSELLERSLSRWGTVTSPARGDQATPKPAEPMGPDCLLGSETLVSEDLA